MTTWTEIPTGIVYTGGDDGIFAGSTFSSAAIAGLVWTYIPSVDWTVIDTDPS